MKKLSGKQRITVDIGDVSVTEDEYSNPHMQSMVEHQTSNESTIINRELS